MNLTIPFSKEILFQTKIAEITSISLEQDVSINDNELLGDFIVSGDYKSLDINVDTTPFSYVIPFSVNLESDINFDTLKYEISAFNYEINNDVLKVNISLFVTADKIIKEKETLFEKVDEEIKEDILGEDLPLCDDNIRNETIGEEIKNDDNAILNTSTLEEDYITYHIHVVKINETIESIASLYKFDKDELINLNDNSTVNIGDKLIIPFTLDEK